MSQRECAGFNWPPPVIPASQPVCSAPRCVILAGPLHSSGSRSPWPATSPPQRATIFLLESVFPASL
jgi:hypothetical protein